MAGRDRRLRQEHARIDDGDRPLQRAPAIFVYGGTVKPGHYKDKDLTIVSAFEAVGEFTAGRISEEDFKRSSGAASRARVVRRHVHGQHDEFLLRGARHEPAALLDHGQPGPETVDGAVEAARVLVQAFGTDEAERHRHARIDRECRQRRDGGWGGRQRVLHFLAIAHAARVPWRSTTSKNPPSRAGAVRPEPSGRFVTTDLHRAAAFRR